MKLQVKNSSVYEIALDLDYSKFQDMFRIESIIAVGKGILCVKPKVREPWTQYGDSDISVFVSADSEQEAVDLVADVILRSGNTQLSNLIKGQFYLQ